jgi:hypothetical protein
MDLAFSPDLPAWLCYAVVILVGLVVAWRRVSARLRDISAQDSPAIWYFPRTWFLFALYALIPVLLFWLLDRTESIHDTSLFAALLVAITYERIMSGQQKTIAVSEGISSLWNPLNTYVASTAAQIKKEMLRSARRWDRFVLDSALTPDQSNPPQFPRLDKMKKVAEQLTADLSGLQAQIQKSEQTTAAPDYVRERQARIYYAEINGSLMYSDGNAWQRLLLDEDIIDSRTYYVHSPRCRSRQIAWLAVALLVLGAVFAARALDRPTIWSEYYLWRLAKNHVTSADLHRTSMALGESLKLDALSPRTFAALADRLRDPGVQVDRAETIVGLLLENRCEAQRLKFPLPEHLYAALRVRNVDVRDRVNQALLFLSPPTGVDEDLRNWNPAAGESLIDLERRISHWGKFWSGLQQHDLCSTGLNAPPVSPAVTAAAEG